MSAHMKADATTTPPAPVKYDVTLRILKLATIGTMQVLAGKRIKATREAADKLIAAGVAEEVF